MSPLFKRKKNLPVPVGAETVAVAAPDSAAPTLPDKRRKRKRRRRLIIAALLLAVVAVMFFLPKGEAGPDVAFGDTTVLAAKDISATVSATGRVESASSTFVYSTLAYPVQSVEVEVGDRVSEGQLLAQLDEEAIRDQIDTQQASLSTSSATSALSLQTAQENYDNYKAALDSGLNTSLNTAQAQVDVAYDSYIKAKNAYERYEKALKDGEEATLLAQKSSVTAASTSLDAAEESYDEARDAAKAAKQTYDAAKDALTTAENRLNELKMARQSALAQDPDADVSELDAQIDAAEDTVDKAATALEKAKTAYDTAHDRQSSADRAMTNAESSYDAAQAQYKAGQTTSTQTVDDYKAAMDSAWRGYQEALTSQKATQQSVQEQLRAYENSLAGARITANDATARTNLRQLKVDLADTAIAAPCAGTVTAVYASVGSSGSGLLFVIEDVADLVVETSVKEYDIATVQAGMPVTIHSDATGDAVYDGTVTSIAPTVAKNALGETNITSTVEFASEVRVTSVDTGLRIGMSVRLEYIVGEAKNALSVPYEAVYSNAAGQTCVLVLAEQADGTFLLSELPVETGLETDLEIVISGAGVTEGLRVANQPQTLLPRLGQYVTVGERVATALSMDAMMAM